MTAIRVDFNRCAQLLKDWAAVNVYVVELNGTLALTYAQLHENADNQLRAIVHGYSQRESDLSTAGWTLTNNNYPSCLKLLFEEVCEDAARNGCMVLCASSTDEKNVKALRNRILLAGFLGDSIVVKNKD